MIFDEVYTTDHKIFVHLHHQLTNTQWFFPTIHNESRTNSMNASYRRDHARSSTEESKFKQVSFSTAHSDFLQQHLEQKQYAFLPSESSET
ncbi:hypothetical protein TNIN_336051 [Trichonephila inaurata madagascariensis]|uniref:Uncharacterized protein n=1 Tax=Trichonephila inaurata madagascariensis TaxID=2747483 RepID=A0A8X6YX06_9ARAC|nr:hypothetical protein TNIN_336051 [Trichonephila inaurata madagascariensis]